MLHAALPRRSEARWILFGGLFTTIGQGLTLPFLFVYLTKVRDLPPTSVGLIFGWIGVVGLGMAPVAGWAIDRFGPRRVMLPGFVLQALGVGAIAFVGNVWQAFAVATLTAISGTPMWSAQTTLLASLTDESERQNIFGLQFTLINLGIGIGGLVSGLIVDVDRPGTFQFIYLLNAVTYLAPVVVLLALPRVGGPIAASPADGEGASAGGGFRQLLADKRFRWVLLFGLTLTTCGYAQIEVGFPAFATEGIGVSPKVVGFALAGNTLTIVLTQLYVLKWLHGRSRSRSLSAVASIFAASWLVLAVAGLIGQSNLLLASMIVVLSSVVFAVGETLLSPVMPAITNALAPDELRGRYNASSGMVWGLAAVIGPVTAAPLIGHGLGAVWLVMIIAGCGLALVLSLILHRRLTPFQDGRGQPVATDQEPALITADALR